jgi:hypothetical protein
MEIEFQLPRFARFVRNVARLASHIQRRVPAPFFRHVQSRRMAAQAQILFVVARSRLQQLKLIV